MAEGSPTVIASRTTAAGRFLELRLLEYRDANGDNRHWECASRTGGCPGAVGIIVHIIPDDQLVLVRQFRPPLNAMSLEFPAGLVDADESVQQAALRELQEETGYTGKVGRILLHGKSSPGMTDEQISLVTVEVDGLAYRHNPPQPAPDPGEFIQVLLAPRRGLLAFLEERQRLGDAVDGKLLAYALALESALMPE